MENQEMNGAQESVAQVSAEQRVVELEKELATTKDMFRMSSNSLWKESEKLKKANELIDSLVKMVVDSSNVDGSVKELLDLSVKELKENIKPYYD